MNELSKRNNKCDQIVMELSIDIIIEILHRFPSKSLARFKSVSRSWALHVSNCRSQRFSTRTIGFFYQPMRTHSQIHFLFTSSENKVKGNFDESVNFLKGCHLHLIASSIGFLLCCEQEIYQRHYYVYNPATRQYFSLPQVPTGTKNVELAGINVQTCAKYVAIGFNCKLDDINNDVISFTVVRYQIPAESTVTIESFSSQSNVWTEITFALQIPLVFYRCHYHPSKWLKSGGAIDGVFYWLDFSSRINVYDSVNMCFWSPDIPDGLTLSILEISRCIRGDPMLCKFVSRT
ncbi:F-box protein At5g49610-like [Capsicum annuum]|uniref:F-box protein At5g49610-like n=1 Tax=Capsicum annuum TaxID=4072 RepID=UPI001FB12661|nr:F-box protein At5g49610-like [Capsicum annuum]